MLNDMPQVRCNTRISIDVSLCFASILYIIYGVGTGRRDSNGVHRKRVRGVQHLPPGAVRLPEDQALAIVADTYDLQVYGHDFLMRRSHPLRCERIERIERRWEMHAHPISHLDNSVAYGLLDAAG